MIPVREANFTISHEIALARKIQDQLIPNRSPAGYICFLYRPMEEVGGDFFDFITFRENDKIGIFISDVSGHGVPAAFITSMIKTIMLQAGNRRANPAELLHYMNDILHNQTGGNFITAENINRASPFAGWEPRRSRFVYGQKPCSSIPSLHGHPCGGSLREGFGLPPGKCVRTPSARRRHQPLSQWERRFD